MLTTEIITDRDTWNENLRQLPLAHILQTWEWGEFKQQTTGWRPIRLAFKDDDRIVAMISIGIRSIGPLKVMYAPKGPALNYHDVRLLGTVLDELQSFAKRQFAIWLKIDPDIIGWTGVPGEEDDSPYLPGQAIMRQLKQRGWVFSRDQIQVRNTISIDLTQDEDTILMQMSQNTRRKVRTGERKDVTVREGSLNDLQILYNLYSITGERDEFLIRPFEYYRLAWEKFIEAGLAHPLIAEYEGKPIAHVILFHFGDKCWYFYGASSNEERSRMPNYQLQWEAMKWAKNHGYKIYDMWGAPDHFNERDSMWGVYQFKRGFRGTVTRHIGAWDYVPNRLLYRGYVELWPRVMQMLKNRSS